MGNGLLLAPFRSRRKLSVSFLRWITMPARRPPVAVERCIPNREASRKRRDLQKGFMAISHRDVE
jgi:hypothetical protein